MGRERQSEVIRGHQKRSEGIRGHQRTSYDIRGHQRSSEDIRGHPRETHDANRPEAAQPAHRRIVLQIVTVEHRKGDDGDEGENDRDHGQHEVQPVPRIPPILDEGECADADLMRGAISEIIRGNRW